MTAPDVKAVHPLRDLPGAYTEAAQRIHAALLIHRPCHTPVTEPWGCEHGHYGHYGVNPIGGLLTGIPAPDQPAECMACTYDDRTITYPCPTALALGVPAPEPTQETAP